MSVAVRDFAWMGNVSAAKALSGKTVPSVTVQQEKQDRNVINKNVRRTAVLMGYALTGSADVGRIGWASIAVSQKSAVDRVTMHAQMAEKLRKSVNFVRDSV